ncbi:hypothetical protein KCP69_07050 [Salmonella enterica subsp. enterica]|nr:hypothetical protein KCP69_07050 [Salmonella enterica subsp. enterica]
MASWFCRARRQKDPRLSSFFRLDEAWSHDDAVPLGTVEIFHTYYTRDNQRISLLLSVLLSEAYASQIEIAVDRRDATETTYSSWLAFTTLYDPLRARMNS